MKLIVGLGNPGTKYAKTRHSVGYMTIEVIKLKFTNPQIHKSNSKFKAEVWEEGGMILAKPTTFMNESGVAVSALSKFYKLSSNNLFVIHDDLDIPLGTYKIQLGRGPKTHKGLLSVYENLGTKDFWHVRIGVENRADKTISGEAYTLMPFEPEEKKIIDRVIAEICKKLVI